MNKNIELTMLINFPDGVDALCSYGDYKAGITVTLAAASVLTRHFMLEPRFGGGKTATIISDVVVDNSLDFIEHFEALRTSIADAFEVGEPDVSITNAIESDIPE